MSVSSMPLSSGSAAPPERSQAEVAAIAAISAAFIKNNLAREWQFFGRTWVLPHILDSAGDGKFSFRDDFTRPALQAFSNLLRRTQNVLLNSVSGDHVSDIDFDHPVMQLRIKMILPLPNGIVWLHHGQEIVNPFLGQFDYEVAELLAWDFFHKGNELCIWNGLAYGIKCNQVGPDESGLAWDFFTAFDWYHHTFPAVATPLASDDIGNEMLPRLSTIG